MDCMGYIRISKSTKNHKMRAQIVGFVIHPAGFSIWWDMFVVPWRVHSTMVPFLGTFLPLAAPLTAVNVGYGM